MVKFTIEYEVIVRLGAIVTFEDQTGKCERYASYMAHSLDQFADMGLDLKRGLDSARVSFVDAPSELQFIVDVKGGVAWYELREFENIASWGGQQTVYDILLKGTCKPNRIIQQISKVLWRVYEEVGLEGYRDNFHRREFPFEKY